MFGKKQDLWMELRGWDTKETEISHIILYYKEWPQIKRLRFDAQIVNRTNSSGRSGKSAKHENQE